MHSPLSPQGGNTALIWASQNGNINVTEALLDAGADVNTQENVCILWANTMHAWGVT